MSDDRPNYICEASGFKVKRLVRQWDGAMVDPRFLDKRNPQDFVRGVKDRQALPNARPEQADTFLVDYLLAEDGSIIYDQHGIPVLTENSRLLRGEDL